MPRRLGGRSCTVTNRLSKAAFLFRSRLLNYIRKRPNKLKELGPFWRHLLKASPTILGISLTMLVVESVGWLDRFETAGIDVFNILQAPREPSHVVVVGITEDDYKTLFSETSPLDYKRLDQIIHALAIGRPRAIGVDLDTASGEFRHLSIPADAPPIVWGQDLDRRNDTARVLPVLGGEQVRLLRPCDATGVALMPEDSDGVIRRYRSHLIFSGETFNSFALAVAEAGSQVGENCAEAGPRKNDEGERTESRGPDQNNRNTG